MEILRAQGLTKMYGEVRAVNGASLAVEEGQWAQVVGGQGAGKTTLRRLLCGRERPDDGAICLAGQELTGLKQGPAMALVRETLGVVPAEPGLWREYTLWENVALPMELAGMERRKARKKARELLELLGVRQMAGARPASLSRCDRQTGALARAAAMGPRLLLLDEFAAGVSPREEIRLWQRLETVVRETGAAVLSLASCRAEAPFERRYAMKNGSLIEEEEGI